MTAMPPISEPYFDEEYETMSRSGIEEIQLERLLATIAHAYEHSALVRTTWDAAKVKPSDVKSIADFREKVPFIDKDAIRRFRDELGDPYGGMLCLPVESLTAINSTSGTTGDPTLVAEQWGAREGRPALMFRDFWGMGVRPGDAFTMFLFTFRGPTYGAAQAIGCTPICVDYSLDELPRLLELSERYGPTMAYQIGGMAIRGIGELEARGLADPTKSLSSYKGIVWAGEPLGSRARGLAERWGVKLYEHTSVGDVTAAFECPAQDGMHIWEDTVFVEGIDPLGVDHRDTAAVDGNRVRCEMVGTALLDRVAPLVRYRSDDIVEFDRRRCACGRTHTRVWTIGRKSDENVVAGRSVLPIDVWDAIESVDAARMGLFQIVRAARETDRLRLRVGYDDDLPETRLGAAHDEIVANVTAAVGIEPVVEFVPNAALLHLGPPHKIPRVTKQ
jgi:phenylacetate-CoA ligase